MTDAYKVCPICDAHNHRNAVLCATCGTTIAEIAPKERRDREESPAFDYDYRLGETDLAEESLGRRGRILSVVLLVLVVFGLGAAAMMTLIPPLFGRDSGISSSVATSAPTHFFGPTVSPGPPSATFTSSPLPTLAPTESPTPAPCVRRVVAGDSLIAIVSRCGYRNLDILPTVMAINGITDETRIQVGQEIVMPRPTPTRDPAVTSPSSELTPVAAAGADEVSDGLALLAFDPFAPTLTPTLLPGLMWHVVQAGENMIAVAVQYETNAKTLSDLNPEIEFALCEFGLAYGGPECTVQLQQGQNVRVPAPTPTRTPVPTASGSETPLPPPTATFNAPVAQSPANNAFFAPLEQVTLRWIGTGRLTNDHVYRVTLINSETFTRNEADTREMFFIIPSEWQATQAGSHSYMWQVSVVNAATDETTYSTEERSFVWQGSG